MSRSAFVALSRHLFAVGTGQPLAVDSPVIDPVGILPYADNGRAAGLSRLALVAVAAVGQRYYGAVAHGQLVALGRLLDVHNHLALAECVDTLAYRLYLRVDSLYRSLDLGDALGQVLDPLPQIAVVVLARRNCGGTSEHSQKFSHHVHLS